MGTTDSRTSAGGWPNFMVQAGATIFASAFFLTPTPTSASMHEGQVRPPRVAPQTNAGFLLQQRNRKRAAEGISELRRIGGLTWDQLARLFRVTRRSLHFWASGNPMSAENEERLHRLIGFIERVDRGSPADTRFALLSHPAGERAPFDLLIEGEYERALELMGEPDRHHSVARSPRVAQKPPSWRPDELVEALTDRAHPSEQLKPSIRGRARRERG